MAVKSYRQWGVFCRFLCQQNIIGHKIYEVLPWEISFRRNFDGSDDLITYILPPYQKCILFQNEKLKKNILIFNHSFSWTKVTFSFSDIAISEGPLFLCIASKGHCGGYRRFDGDMKTLWNNLQPISLCNQCAHIRMDKEKRFKAIDFKSQFRMKALEKLSYGKLVKLLYVSACVGFFLEEAFVCLVHYVSK